MAVVLFPNTQAAVRAEQLFKEEGIGCRLIPTPRHLGSACSLALLFPSAERERVQQMLNRAGVYYGGIHEI